ncbi:MAG: hypothetical protein R3C03_16250 [Pirellulaceae bacterium]
MTSQKIKQLMFLIALIISFTAATPSAALCQDTGNFIWSPIGKQADQSSCFFRKRFTLVSPEKAELTIASSGDYQIYLNGKLAHSGQPSAEQQSFDVSEFVYPGINLVALKVASEDETENGVSLKLRVKEKGEVRWRALVTDSTWTTHQSEFEGWQRNTFRELSWIPAKAGSFTPQSSKSRSIAKSNAGANEKQSSTAQNEKPEIREMKAGESRGLFGALATKLSDNQSDSTKEGSSTNEPKQEPAKKEVLAQTNPIQPRHIENKDSQPTEIAKAEMPETKRESVPVKQVSNKPTDSEPVGSNQASDTNEPGPESTDSVVPVFQTQDEFQVDAVMSGEETGSILAMTFDEFGHLIFSQEGGNLLIADLSIPFGETRVATLCDEVENCQGLLCVNGKLYVTGSGPDGLGLYCLERIDPASTTMTVKKTLLKFTGELGEHGAHGLTFGPDGFIYCSVGNASGIKDLPLAGPYKTPYEVDLRPRYEDPSGHANGIRSPGGTVIRMSLDGKNVQTFAAGVRNAYDLTFNPEGDLFVHDSDMESDLGLPWYRPTALYHVTAGVDLGWRSGWAKFPEYYPDTIAPISKTGRGSPSGAICYNHIQFPVRYHGALFLADWSEGRILSVQLKREGSTYTTHTEDFLKGKPLNILIWKWAKTEPSTLQLADAEQSGGVYRIAWDEAVPDSVIEYENDPDSIAASPQPNSAWAMIKRLR